MGLTWTGVTQASELRDKADAAVAGVLFEYDGVSEYSSYRVNAKGFVDITFPRDMPESLYGEIVTRLQEHPDIDGVLAGKGGPSCGLW
jgi:hypothetical protein